MDRNLKLQPLTNCNASYDILKKRKKYFSIISIILQIDKKMFLQLDKPLLPHLVR